MKRLFFILLFIPLLLSAEILPNTFRPLQTCYSPSYYYPSTCHWMTGLSVLGDSLELEDGAVWKTDQRALSDLFYWSSSDPLILTQNLEWFSSFQFRLVNQATGGSVPVNLFLGPVLANCNAKFLADFDFQHGVAYLTDGTRWEVCPRDHSHFLQWILNDCILIGSNSGWESSYDSILINSNMNHYIRARQF